MVSMPVNPIIERARAAARLGAKVTDLPRYTNRDYTGGFTVYIDGVDIGIVGDDDAYALREFVKSLRKPKFRVDMPL